MAAMTWVRAVAATAVMAVGATTAGAQGFNFHTTGYFTSSMGSCNQSSPGALTVTCTASGGTATINFTGRDYRVAEPAGFANGATVTLGNFSTSGTGMASFTGSDVGFTLVIHQSMPTVGTGQASGFITGTLSRPAGAPSFSDLVWRPNEIVNIGGVTYDLVFRDAGMNGIGISVAGNTTIEAVGTVVPEPSTILLLGSGIAGLGLFGLRSRRRGGNTV